MTGFGIPANVIGMAKPHGPHDGSVRVNGAAVREIRKRTGLSGVGLAAGVGVSAQYLRRIENGVIEYVGPTLFGRLNHALRIQDRRALMADPCATSGPDAPHGHLVESSVESTVESR